MTKKLSSKFEDSVLQSTKENRAWDLSKLIHEVEKKKLSDTDTHVGALTDEGANVMDVKTAEERIQNLIILNAWRHQTENNKHLEINVKKLTNQVESLQLQIYALKHLLDAEKARVVQYNNDLKKILNALEEYKQEKHLIFKEKEQLEIRLHGMEEKFVELENDCRNQKNELLTARSEAQTWEKQLEKEREKLSKAKDEKKFFIEEDIQEAEESKEAISGSNSKKTSRESRIKSTSGKGGKKNPGKGREDRGVGRVDFGKNVGCIKKLLKESLSLFDEPD